MPTHLQPEDRLDIHDLVARYAWALDTADVDEFVGCFSTHGELVWDSFDVPLRWQGEKQLRTFIEGLCSLPDSAGRQHHVSNLRIRGTAEGAAATAFVLVTLRKPDGTAHPHVTGYYEDELRVEQGSWKLHSRRIRDWAGPVLRRFPGQTGERSSRPRPAALDILLGDGAAGK